MPHPRLIIVLLILSRVFSLSAAEAHHVSSPPTSGNRVSFFQGTKNIKPLSHLNVVYDFVQFDQSGQMHTSTLWGEWALTPKISLQGAFPLTYLDHRFTANTSGFGDISIGGKLMLWNGKSSFVYLSTLWSLPTGNESDNLGRGEVAQQTDIFTGFEIGKWTFFVSPGFQFGYAAATEPILKFATGISTPTFCKKFYVSLSAETSVLLDSPVFHSGSGELQLAPQIHWMIDRAKHWTASLGVRISIADWLTIPKSTIIAANDPALLNDIRWGTSVGIDYRF